VSQEAYNDHSIPYHIVFGGDTGQATASQEANLALGNLLRVGGGHAHFVCVFL